MTDAGAVGNFPDKSASFEFNQKITVSTWDYSTKNVAIMVPLKCLSNFCRTLEMPVTNCELISL